MKQVGEPVNTPDSPHYFIGMLEFAFSLDCYEQTT